MSNGGLKLQDQETKVRSLHIKWIKNINDMEYKAAWKEYLEIKFTGNQNIDTKDIYWHLLTDITKRTTSEKKWREKTDLQLMDRNGPQSTH